VGRVPAAIPPESHAEREDIEERGEPEEAIGRRR
jgi:hypothetical protein